MPSTMWSFLAIPPIPCCKAHRDKHPFLKLEVFFFVVSLKRSFHDHSPLAIFINPLPRYFGVPFSRGSFASLSPLPGALFPFFFFILNPMPSPLPRTPFFFPRVSKTRHGSTRYSNTY